MQLADFIRHIPEEERAKIAVPRANDPDVIESIGEAIKLGIAKFVLIGEEAKIREVAASCKVDISSAEIIEEAGDEAACCNLAAKMVKEKRADLMMKGLVQTSNFMKAVLNKEFGLVPEGALLSHVALFEVSGYSKLLMVTDAAINIAPDVEQKARILENALKIARGLGINAPKVACVSAVEKVNPKIQSTLDADALTKLSAEGRFGDAIIEGPFGLDAAISKHAAETKGIKSNVAGEPDILLMPALDAANVLYKSLTGFAKAQTASVVAGSSVPVILTSRADSEKTKLASIALAAHLAKV